MHIGQVAMGLESESSVFLPEAGGLGGASGWRVGLIGSVDSRFNNKIARVRERAKAEQLQSARLTC